MTGSTYLSVTTTVRIETEEDTREPDVRSHQVRSKCEYIVDAYSCKPGNHVSGQEGPLFESVEPLELMQLLKGDGESSWYFYFTYLLPRYFNDRSRHFQRARVCERSNRLV